MFWKDKGERKFHYLDQIIVVKGFYVGCTGTVISCVRSGREYVVKLNMITGETFFYPSDWISLIEQGKRK